MNQPALFVEDINEALREIVRALGGAKVVGLMLWPEKAMERAAADVNACLNVHRAEHFTPEQMTLLFSKARAIGFHLSKQWFDEATGYVAGAPLEPEDERAKLQRAFVESIAQQQRIVDRMERLTATATLRTIAK